MGADISQMNRRTFAYVQENKVRLYSKENFKGNVYEIDYGNYTSAMFIKMITPDNIFSLTIPPNTSVAMFCGDTHDYGGKGSIHIINVTNERTDVPLLPVHVRGSIRSLSITKTIDNSMRQSSLPTGANDMNNTLNVFSGSNVNLEYFTKLNTQDDDKISDAYDFIMIMILIVFVLLIIKN